jgi:hypothetical protein
LAHGKHCWPTLHFLKNSAYDFCDCFIVYDIIKRSTANDFIAKTGGKNETLESFADSGNSKQCGSVPG